jgi:hypothetical protein
LPSQPIDLPWNVVETLSEQAPAAEYQTPYHWAVAYALAAGLLFVLDLWPAKAIDQPPESVAAEVTKD